MTRFLFFSHATQVLWKRASTLEAEALLQEARDISERASLMQSEAMKIHDDIKTAQAICVVDIRWLCGF